MSLSGDSSGGDSGERLRRGDGELHIVVCSLGWMFHVVGCSLSKVFHGAALILGFRVVVSLCGGIGESCLLLVERRDGDLVAPCISEFGCSAGLVVVSLRFCSFCCGDVAFTFSSDFIFAASVFWSYIPFPLNMCLFLVSCDAGLLLFHAGAVFPGSCFGIGSVSVLCGGASSFGMVVRRGFKTASG